MIKINKVEAMKTLNGINSELSFIINDDLYIGHLYKWHDEDDLCVRMQEIFDITTSEFVELWEKVKSIFKDMEDGKLYTIKGEDND